MATTWKSCVQHILWSVVVFWFFSRFPGFSKPAFSKFHVLWGQLLSVTTFTLTFFVNEAYSVFRMCLSTCRLLQGRLNDFIMAMAGFAQRQDIKPESRNHLSKQLGSQFTPHSFKVLLVVSRYIRLFNVLYYASLTRSHRPLLTPRGMRRMVSRGLLTNQEYQLLMAATNIPATRKHNLVQMWMFRTVMDACRAGHLDGGWGFESHTMTKLQEIRAVSASMESILKGRMPFAYAHIVQVLIDSVLWMYPLMALSEGMSLSFGMTLAGSGLLTASYQGLFDLAKQFLDPFHNENFWSGEDALVVDTLIAETNAGSMRWVDCLEEMPISYQSLVVGDLDSHILPVEGYSKQEADQSEQEARDKEQQEKQKEYSEKKTSEQVVTVFNYYADKVAGELEAVEEEFEATQQILKAPPAYEFVPGLDDKNSTTPYTPSKDDKKLKMTNQEFMDVVKDEFKETKDILEENFIIGVLGDSAEVSSANSSSSSCE